MKLIVRTPRGRPDRHRRRIVAEALAKEWDRRVIIENIAAARPFRAPSPPRAPPTDGTRCEGTSAWMVVNPAIMDKVPYDSFNDFT